MVSRTKDKGKSMSPIGRQLKSSWTPGYMKFGFPAPSIGEWHHVLRQQPGMKSAMPTATIAALRRYRPVTESSDGGVREWGFYFAVSAPIFFTSASSRKMRETELRQ